MLRKYFLALLIISLSATVPAIAVGGQKYTTNLSYDLWPRTYDYYIPDSAKKDSPMLILLHGMGGNKRQFQNGPHPIVPGETNYIPGLIELADEKGINLVWPSAVSIPVINVGVWNGGLCCNPFVDDNGFLSKMIADVSDQVPIHSQNKASIDPSRVYIIGHSNGALLAHRMAVQAWDTIAAIAPLAYPIDPWVHGLGHRNPRTRGVPVVMIHALDDTTYPYDGGIPVFSEIFAPIEYLLSIDFDWPAFNTPPKGLDIWSGFNECQTRTPEIIQTNEDFPGKSWKEQTSQDCRHGADVKLVTLPEGDHFPIYPDQNGGYEFFRETWSFLEQYQKPGHNNDHMWAGQSLFKTQFLKSKDGSKKLVFESNSNLVVLNDKGKKIWSAGTRGVGADRLTLEGDGNLVLWRNGRSGFVIKSFFGIPYLWYENVPPKALWATHTNSGRNTKLHIDNTGVIELSSNAKSVWRQEPIEASEIETIERPNAIRRLSFWQRLLRFFRF